MDQFLNTQLHPAETCIVCTEHFSESHQPVALPCKHIFGYECIKRWFKNGRGNTRACPTCRYVVVEKLSSHSAFDVTTVWMALSEESPERLHRLMVNIWGRLQELWQQNPDGKFTVTEMLDHAIIPALVWTARHTAISEDQEYNSIQDCYNLMAASWDSLDRPDSPSGLAIPLVRLARLMSSASTILPRWLTTNPRVNRLIWRANFSLGLTEKAINWEFIIEAARLDNQRYFALLHLHTLLISQSITHNSQSDPWPMSRHKTMNLVVERCCTKVGGQDWEGKPSNQFKDVLVVVYEELRRYQLEKRKISLRGHDGEEIVVRSIWALADWSVSHDGRG